MSEPVRIKLADPCITEEEEQAVLRVLRSGRLVSGPEVAHFEEALRERTGRAHAVMVSSGSAALTAGMHALDVGPGTQVVVPAFTFPSPAIAAANLGAGVRLCDVDASTMNLTWETLEPVLDDSVGLVVGIDQFGAPCPSPELEDRLKERGIPFMVDSACSLGSSLNGVPCGAFGVLATLSFHPRKVVTTGEGGAVLTDDEELAKEVRRFASLGMEKGGFAGLGHNLRPPEMGAAIGLCRLAKLDEIVSKRQALAARYAALPLRFQEAPKGASVNVQTLAAWLPEGIRRSDLMGRLAEKGVESQVASYDVGSIEALSKILVHGAKDTPTSRALHERGIALPLHDHLTIEEVDTVCGLVQDWLSKNGEI